MDDVKKWVATAAIAALVLLAGGWTLLISPQRSEAADLHDEVDAQRTSAQQLQTRLGVLRQKQAALPEQEAALAEVDRLVPATAALPELVRALTGAARSAGVELVSVAPGTLTPVVVGAEPAAGSTPPAAGTAPTADAAAPPAAAAAPGAGGALAALPLSLDVLGGFYEVQQFLAELEELPRALRVTALTVGSGSAGQADSVSPGAADDLTLRLTAEVYVSTPATEQATAPAAPTVEAPTGSGPAPSADQSAVTPTTES